MLCRTSSSVSSNVVTTKTVSTHHQMSPGEKTIPLENHCLAEREWEVTPGVTIRPDDVFSAQGGQFGTILGSQSRVQMPL